MKITYKPSNKLTAAQLLAVVDNAVKLLQDHVKYLPALQSTDIYDPKLIKIALRAYKRKLKNPSAGAYILLDKDGVHGSAIAMPWTNYKDNVGICSLYIDPLYRGKGLGTKLLRRILADARKKKLKRLFLGYYLKNKAADLYTRLGYKPFAVLAVKDIE